MNETPMRLFALGWLLIDTAGADFKSKLVKCDEKFCSTYEYCSVYDNHCKPCSSICDLPGQEMSDDCISNCSANHDSCLPTCPPPFPLRPLTSYLTTNLLYYRNLRFLFTSRSRSLSFSEYLDDKQYVLLEQYREEVDRLWILVVISMAMAVLSLLSNFYVVMHRFARWDKIRAAITRTFTGNETIKVSFSMTENSNNNGNDNRRKEEEEDAELGGTSKRNGLKLAMQTISASVAPSRHPEPACNRNDSGTGLDNVTSNTISTTLSRRHPSEDTTLDYAYDNPAMTPSPEAVQLRPKRESSF
ncbi:uncharacterized protein LOC143425423 [Xylocopa sonorina]|uniref:uncharacterized protein LOC143425423 n=1 Tax=Xylocopa sonorina TaxID=1818115 RepID=UPI00403AC028